MLGQVSLLGPTLYNFPSSAPAELRNAAGGADMPGWDPFVYVKDLQHTAGQGNFMLRIFLSLSHGSGPHAIHPHATHGRTRNAKPVSGCISTAPIRMDSPKQTCQPSSTACQAEATRPLREADWQQTGRAQRRPAT